jgi:hypothetical protein
MDIDNELATYLQPGPFSVIVAACDTRLTPETVRAWGTRLLDDRHTIEVLVGREPARRLVDNLRARSAMAMAIANLTTYQAIQLKGRCTDIGEADESDRRRVQVHGEAFVAGLQLVGIGERAARGILVSDVVRLRFVPEQLFNQTPGPGAGTSR